MKNVSSITMQNLHEYSIPLSESKLQKIFINSENELHLNIVEDQVIALHPKATKYLNTFINTQNYLLGEFVRKQYFKEHKEFIATDKTEEEIKKWLYNLGIPFSQKVILQSGYILTWKMLLKFSCELFKYDYQLVFDTSLNWLLRYENNHLEEFNFLENRTQNAEKESEKIMELNKLKK